VSETRLSKGEVAYRFAYGLSQTSPHAAWRHYLPSDERQDLYGPALLGELSRDPLALYQLAYTDATGCPAERGLVADQSFYLPADMLVKVDRVSMAHGLELRVPFLDRRIMELANRMAIALFFGDDGRSTKLVLRKALQQLGAPRNLCNGPKRGFNVPINTLLRGSLGHLADRLLDRDADVFAPLLSPDGVRRLWRRHRRGKQDEKYAIWTLLTLGSWIEKEHLH
jgi:asparagine synthase (glutamine-hydrolysing)